MIELTQVNTKQICIEREVKRNKMAMGWSCAEKRDANLTKVPSKWKQNCKRTREKKHIVACRAGWENITLRR